MQSYCLVQKVGPPIGQILLKVPTASIPEENSLDAERKKKSGLLCRPTDVDLFRANASGQASLCAASSNFSRTRRTRLDHSTVPKLLRKGKCYCCG